MRRSDRIMGTVVCGPHIRIGYPPVFNFKEDERNQVSKRRKTYNSISVVVVTRSCVGLLPYLVFHQGKIFGLERSHIYAN
ncbi:hypothetical protein BDV24DRAFT_133130 [Aspergillus arachidicola]|uniref:Uncharacterized protein n=1 Tax=Aspergillus arachidicola TaxID=656916 RepID=A0A5N6Y7U3_9EURO|nr:hypothetical protein BDV24DRAFT_133130 [Aspergillus arachidicola]